MSVDLGSKMILYLLFFHRWQFTAVVSKVAFIYRCFLSSVLSKQPVKCGGKCFVFNRQSSICKRKPCGLNVGQNVMISAQDLVQIVHNPVQVILLMDLWIISQNRWLEKGAKVRELSRRSQPTVYPRIYVASARRVNQSLKNSNSYFGLGTLFTKIVP